MCTLARTDVLCRCDPGRKRSAPHDPRAHPPPTTQGELDQAGATPSSTAGGTGSAPELVELCRRAEATGADSLWAVDHLFWPHPMGESLTTLAVAAVATSRPTLGTCVLQLPLRRPAAVAKQATALQLLSGGRFVLGLGVGIHEERVRTGRRRLPPPGPAHGRGRRRAAGRLGRYGRAGLRLRAGAGLVPGPAVVRRLQRRRPAAGRGRGRRLGPPVPRPGRVRGRAGGAAARDGRGRP